MNHYTVLAGLLLGTSALSPAAPPWEWHGAAAVVDVDLVRADVRVVTTRGAPGVSILPGGADAGAATFSATSADGAVRIRDRYPPRGLRVDECLPPVDERGDFWTYAVPLRVTIAVPPGTKLRVRVISGSIHSMPSRDFDLQTRDGTVRTGP